MSISLRNFGRCSSREVPFWSESAWSPFELIQFTPRGSVAEGAMAAAGTKVDWLETEEAHVIRADLPGLKKEDIKVEVEDRLLSISGERSTEEEKREEKRGGTWHTVERSSGKFLRRFKLPSNAKAEAVSAKVENGVLTVTVPKVQAQEPEKRSIEVA